MNLQKKRIFLQKTGKLTDFLRLFRKIFPHFSVRNAIIAGSCDSFAD